MSPIRFLYLCFSVVLFLTLSVNGEESFYAYKSGEKFEVGRVKDAIFADSSTKGFMVSLEGESVFVKSFVGGRTQIRVVKNDFSEVTFDIEIVMEARNTTKAKEGSFGVSLRKNYNLTSWDSSPSIYNFSYRNKLTDDIHIHLQTSAEDLEEKVGRDKFKKPIVSLHTQNYSYYDQGSSSFSNNTYSSVSASRGKVLEIRKLGGRISLSKGTHDDSRGISISGQTLGEFTLSSELYRVRNNSAYNLQMIRSKGDSVSTASIVSDLERVSSDLSLQKTLVSNPLNKVTLGFEAAYRNSGPVTLVSDSSESRLKTSYSIISSKESQGRLRLHYSNLLRKWKSYSIAKDLHYKFANISVGSSVIKTNSGEDTSTFSLNLSKRISSRIFSSLSTSYRNHSNNSTLQFAPSLSYNQGRYSLRVAATSQMVENDDGELGLVQSYNLQSEIKFKDSRSLAINLNKSKDHYSIRSVLSLNSFHASLSTNQSKNRVLSLSYNFKMGVAEKPVSRLINRFRSIKGRVFYDENGDGLLQEGEGLKDSQVFLLVNGKEQRSVMTDSRGSYLFRDIDPNYRYEIKVLKDGFTSEQAKYRVSKEFTVRDSLLFRPSKIKYEAKSSGTRVFNAKLKVLCANNSYDFSREIGRHNLSYSLDHDCRLILDVMKDDSYYSYSPEVEINSTSQPLLLLERKDKSVYGLFSFKGKVKIGDLKKEVFKSGDREYHIGDDFYFAIEGRSPMTIKSKNYQCKYRQFLIRESVVKYRCTRRVK